MLSHLKDHSSQYSSELGRKAGRQVSGSTLARTFLKDHIYVTGETGETLPNLAFLSNIRNREEYKIIKKHEK